MKFAYPFCSCFIPSLVLNALSNEVPNSRHLISFEVYAHHIVPLIGSTSVIEFKKSISSKKWRQKFTKAVGEQGCLEHNKVVYVRGNECTYDPQRLFLFKNQIRTNNDSIIKMIRWQKKKERKGK